MVPCSHTLDILVTSAAEKYVAKISDFGLSRLVNDNAYYKNQNSAIPFRWAAPESFAFGKFSTKSGTEKLCVKSCRRVEFWCFIVGIIQ